MYIGLYPGLHATQNIHKLVGDAEVPSFELLF